MSSSSPRTWRYRVFASFHGPDVRKTLVSHLRTHFNDHGITMFDDQKIERSQTIAPSLRQAIRESRISIVMLSRNYASSSWCLEELLEILKCEQDIGQIVMTIFYGVDPSHVRNQTGDFGKVFKETCGRKTEEERQRWTQALTNVGNIAGEHFQNWDNESKMIEKIARDISNKLNTTISKDFEDMVGIEAHLQKMQSLLHLEYEDEAMMVGICGPAGIGKTTIARALHSRLSSSFQLTCFMENIRGSYNSGLDDYGLKLCLQEQLLSKILNQNGMRTYHLGAIPKRLCDQKVLIILDDVDDLKQLEALANETNWFGPGSRIIVTTEDQELLEQHDVNNTYHVDFPTKEESSKIFCRYAFGRCLAPDGFEKLVERVTKLCSNLPLGLRVMGSSLRRKGKKEWEGLLHRLENSLDRKIEGVLRAGYNNLHENDQSLFLCIAFFFNYEDVDHVMAMLSESNLDVKLGLQTLAYKSLIQISTKGEVVMHKLLQQVGRKAVQRQDPGKRQILIDTDEIRDVFENASGSRRVMGISLDLSKIIDGMDISARAFKNMRYLRFLSVFRTRVDRNDDLVHIPKEMEFPQRLRLLHWELYPGKCLPSSFNLTYLVELSLQNNKLEKLWGGTQPLTNLKKMDLFGSYHLKELPDLSKATSLQRLDLGSCSSLVEIPSSIGKLQKLEWLDMGYCVKLQVVPNRFNLTSLESVNMLGCWRMRKFPDISTNITYLSVADTMLQDLPESVNLWSRLRSLVIDGGLKAKSKQKFKDIERIPDWIKDLRGLQELQIVSCPKLVILPELSVSLRRLLVKTCESLEKVSFSFHAQIKFLYFPNCFRLGREARRVITQQSLLTCLPGRTMPAEFDHRAEGDTLTIQSRFYRFRVCAVVTPIQEMRYCSLFCRVRINGCSIEREIKHDVYRIRMDHLFMSYFDLLEKHVWLERDKDNEVLFEFRTSSKNIEVIECGVQILSDEAGEQRSISSSSYGSFESCLEQVSEVDDDERLSLSLVNPALTGQCFHL